VLRTAVPRLEVYAQSFGMPIKQAGCDVWRQVARDLIERCVPRWAGPVVTTERERRKAQMAAAAARRAEPDASPAGRTAIRSKPVRITLDLSPELYRQLDPVGGLRPRSNSTCRASRWPTRCGR
jgi:hypothetical protein